jgi:hypothetical protein
MPRVTVADVVKRDVFVGARVGSWTLIEYFKSVNGRRGRFLCRCDCGTEKTVDKLALSWGLSQSCGCQKPRLISERICGHGHTTERRRSRTHRAWSGMKNRCYNANDRTFTRYGARGVSVCQEWRESFEAFLRDMGEHPGKGYSLDRIDSAGHYTPDNCRWATAREQCNNRRVTRFLTYKGETMPLADWARRLGCDHRTLHKRIDHGWSVDDVIGRPIRRRRRRTT